MSGQHEPVAEVASAIRIAAGATVIWLILQFILGVAYGVVC